MYVMAKESQTVNVISKESKKNVRLEALRVCVNNWIK